MKRRAAGWSALGVTGAILSLSLAFSPAVSAITIGGPSDCDNNAIISCGAHSTGALMADYNSSAYVRAVYAYFGISANDIANLPNTNQAGIVTSSGTVQINGKTVANNAITGGRQNIAGSTQVNFQGVTFYKRPPRVSFQQASLPAFVAMKNGVFQFAVIASCGNAVMAHPTTATTAPPKAAVGPARAVSKPAAKPRPTPQPPQPPAPTQTQVQQQGQVQEVNINNSNTQTIQTTPQTAAESTPAETTSEQPSTQPAASLVNTGPAGTVGVFLAATSLGMIGYRRFILRKILH